MYLNTRLIILAICASFFLLGNSAAYSAANNQEQVCRSAFQGRVAWNQAGDKRWQPINLNKLCKGAINARATVNCFKAQIRNHNNWSRGINACKGNASALQSSSPSTRARPPRPSASTRVRPPRPSSSTRARPTRPSASTRVRPTQVRPPLPAVTEVCPKKDCYASAKLIKGGVKKLGPINIINDVKYGFYCGNGRNSTKEPLDDVDRACQFHDGIDGGKMPYTNGNGVTAAQSCSRQLRFVDKLTKINRSRLTNGASRTRNMLLAQFPTLGQIRTLCDSISVGEGTVDGVEDALISVGILNTSANEWGVDIDSCHSDMNHTGTKNGITVEFWASNNMVGTRYKNGVSDNCYSDDASYSFKTKEKITHIIVRTNGNDGFFIDELYLYKGGTLKKRHGRDNGRGWCLSTDPKDGKGAWKSKVSSCLRQKQFNY